MVRQIIVRMTDFAQGEMVRLQAGMDDFEDPRIYYLPKTTQGCVDWDFGAIRLVITTRADHVEFRLDQASPAKTQPPRRAAA